MIKVDELKEIFKIRGNKSEEIARLVHLITEEDYKPNTEEMGKLKEGLQMANREAKFVFFNE